MSNPIKICTVKLPNGKECGHIMEEYKIGNGKFYYICSKCGNMK